MAGRMKKTEPLKNAPARPPEEINRGDLALFSAVTGGTGPQPVCLQTLDELLERDRNRQADGFPRKIRIGRLIKPGKSGKEKIVVVPTTVEEKLIHDRIRPPEEDEPSSGSGEGEEGEVIGEEPIRQEGGEGGAGGEGAGPHEIESSAYELGRVLTEKFELPDLKDKGKKRSLTTYTYDLTDRSRGRGQVLDKKATLREIVKTNIALGNIPDVAHIDPVGFIISPDDLIYRILSRETDYESQALVFFVRDYSGSMSGRPTELVVSQHVLIYSWLTYQYSRQVETRFILHDTEAREVPDFHTYYNSKVAGGTRIVSAYRLVNEIVARESLERDYNIYVFHGTDGDDWDKDGTGTVAELKKMLAFSNRVGVTIAGDDRYGMLSSEFEQTLQKSGLLESEPHLKLDLISRDADEARLVNGIKKLLS